MNLKELDSIFSEYQWEDEVYDIWFDWDLYYDL